MQRVSSSLSRVRRDADLDATDTDYPDTVVLDFMDTAMSDLRSELVSAGGEWWSTFLDMPIVDGTQWYSLPEYATGLVKSVSHIDTDGTERMPRIATARDVAQQLTSDWPEAVRIEGSQFAFVPNLRSGTARVRYESYPFAMGVTATPYQITAVTSSSVTLQSIGVATGSPIYRLARSAPFVHAGTITLASDLGTGEYTVADTSGVNVGDIVYEGNDPFDGCPIVQLPRFLVPTFERRAVQLALLSTGEFDTADRYRALYNKGVEQALDQLRSRTQNQAEFLPEQDFFV